MRVRLVLVMSLLVVTACDSKPASSGATVTATTRVLPQLAADFLPPQQRSRVEVNIHCGVAWFSRVINGTWWYADEAPREMDWTPDEWRSGLPRGEQVIEVEVELSADGAVLVASRNGRDVIYKPVPIEDRDRYCA